MKKIKMTAVFSACIAFSLALGACSAVDSITDPVSEESSAGDSSFVDGKEVDESLAAPEFSSDLNYTTSMAQDSEYTLDGTATSSDGGEITYQWYVSNVESNGGGTAIEGATEAVYTVDTSEVGTEFYYVVASNNHGDSYNMSVSGINCATVFSKGEWTTDDFGGTRYMGEDGTYPVSTWALIGSDTYLFDENGYRAAGWVVDGTTAMYFAEDGIYQYSEEVAEGTTVGEDGNLVDPSAAETQTEATDANAADQAAEGQDAAAEQTTDAAQDAAAEQTTDAAQDVAAEQTTDAAQDAAAEQTTDAAQDAAAEQTTDAAQDTAAE